MEHVVLKHRRTTLKRCQKYISDELEFFNDNNLCKKIYPEKHPLKSLMHYGAEGRIGYDKAMQGEYKPAKIGDRFGPVWSSHWFCVELEIPLTWLGKEVHLLWDSQSEAMVWRDGQPFCGLSGEDRVNVLLSEKLTAAQTSETLYIEMACNGLFGVGDSLIGPPKADQQFTLTRAELAVRDPVAFKLNLHLQVLTDMAETLGEDSERGNEAMLTANRMVNQVVADGGSNFTRAIEIGTHFLKQRNGHSQHVVHAVGNCHIDSAWLWPYTETIRKCARSWSTTIRLMEKYTDLIFACSQAQQFEWVKERYPSLYRQMKEKISSGQFIPVGACWVEMDGNMPSGESFVRQFLYGQRFFKREFGVLCKEFWLPDTFGYSAQIPQIIGLFGLDRFLTQKLSWNLVNKFPHNTFWWEGIDGSRVLTHFPPGDNYCMKAWPKEVLKTRNNHSDKGRSPRSMYLYGYGDGGQGPTDEMMERLRRMEDVDGLPKVRLTSPDDYFSAVEREDAGNLCTWSGELYLEMHNGTYTTQAETKYYNRRCEGWLHDCEVISAVASVVSPYRYPSEELLRLWKLLLLNQFHDVLPGSSIAEVYKDAVAYYKDIESSVKELTIGAIGAVANTQGETQAVVFNSLGWDRQEVICLIGPHEGTSNPNKRMRREEPKDRQICKDGSTLVLVKVGSCGMSPVEPLVPRAPVSAITRIDGSIVVKNSCLEAVITPAGHITELYVGGGNRNAMMEGQVGNMFVMFDDMPLFWDAWDVMHYHLETRRTLDQVLQEATVEECGPLRAAIKVSLRISEMSSISQTVILEADCPYLRFDTQVEWHESHKFLKVEIPTSVKADNATYEIQFGHLKRPTHANTSWDMAQFEVCSHRWADVSEYGYGVAVLNDSKYGFSTARNIMRLSLLRSPKAPDPNADMGTQKFTYALMPHTGSFQSAGVIEQAHRLNSPVIQAKARGEVTATSYFRLDNPQVVLDTVKQAEDDEKALVLRLYESFGGAVTVRLTTVLPVKSVTSCNGYEEELESQRVEFGDDNGVSLSFTPFQIVSLLMKF